MVIGAIVFAAWAIGDVMCLGADHDPEPKGGDGLEIQGPAARGDA
jgi:hypothetical protein